MAKKNSLQQKFAQARDAMNEKLIERHDEVDMVLTALLCKENPLLVGPPGTGKSFLIDNLMRWIVGTKKFGILLGKFSMPDEVFGPISVKDLKEGRYSRVTTGKLPEAEFAFIDEVFKASTAILNSMLKILNERKFEKGDGTEITCPLRLALAASNEWPDAQELGALFDRFTLRKTVRPVSRIGRTRLLRERNHEPKFAETITLEELDQAHTEAMSLEFSDTAWDTLDEILSELNKDGIHPGDRRMKKGVNIARAYAYLQGADEVKVVHLEVLRYVLWDEAVEQESKCHKIVGRLSNPTGSKITDIMIQASSVVELSAPEEAVSKLQDLQRQIKEMPDHERKMPAINHLGKEIKKLFNKVIGIEV